MPYPSVFRRIKKGNYRITPFKVHKEWYVDSSSFSGSGTAVHLATHRKEKTPIGTTTLTTYGQNFGLAGTTLTIGTKADNDPRNPFWDNSYQNVIWHAIDHKYYKHPYDPAKNLVASNQRKIEKRIFISASSITMPYFRCGESIKKGSVRITDTTNDFTLYDDKQGNLRDPLIDSQSFATASHMVGYWGFNNEFRKFKTNTGTHSKPINFESNVYELDIHSKAQNVSFDFGIKTTGPTGSFNDIPNSGIMARFDGTGYIKTDAIKPLNFDKDDDFAISFWLGGNISQSVDETLTPESYATGSITIAHVPSASYGHCESGQIWQGYLGWEFTGSSAVIFSGSHGIWHFILKEASELASFTDRPTGSGPQGSGAIPTFYVERDVTGGSASSRTQKTMEHLRDKFNDASTGSFYYSGSQVSRFAVSTSKNSHYFYMTSSMSGSAMMPGQDSFGQRFGAFAIYTASEWADYDNGIPESTLKRGLFSFPDYYNSENLNPGFDFISIKNTDEEHVSFIFVSRSYGDGWVFKNTSTAMFVNITSSMHLATKEEVAASLAATINHTDSSSLHNLNLTATASGANVHLTASFKGIEYNKTIFSGSITGSHGHTNTTDLPAELALGQIATASLDPGTHDGTANFANFLNMAGGRSTDRFGADAKPDVFISNIISKRGVHDVTRYNKKTSKRTVVEENLTINRYPFDIGIYNHKKGPEDNGKIVFRRSDGQTSYVSASATQCTGSQYHIVAQKSSSMLELWIDGTREIQSEYNDANEVKNHHKLVFGALNTNQSLTSSLGFSGSLDEIRIYNQSLDENAIKSLANNHYISSSAYQTSVAGNVFYKTGQTIVSSVLPKYYKALGEGGNVSSSQWVVDYQGTHTIWENEVLVEVPAGTFNVTMNPSALAKANTDRLKKDFTGSLTPYITTIGLYNDNAQLLAIGKLAQPITKRSDVDMNFIVRWDY